MQIRPRCNVKRDLSIENMAKLITLPNPEKHYFRVEYASNNQ